MGFLVSPSLSPFAFGFLVARARSVSPFLDAFLVIVTHVSWRWAYGIGSMYGALVLLLIAFFGRET
jgi:hypothetical protein